MLVLSRKRNEKIIVGSGPSRVVFTVVDIRGDKIRIGIEADKSIPVHREEVAERIAAEEPPLLTAAKEALEYIGCSAGGPDQNEVSELLTEAILEEERKAP